MTSEIPTDFGGARGRTFAPFEYMAWAKSHSGPIRLHLGQSGVAPPADEELGPAPRATDLAQRGPDMPPLVRARLAARYGVPEGRVMVTLGTSQALYLLCASLLSPGERVLVESPDYELLHKLPELHRAKVSRFTRRMDEAFRLPSELPARIRSERPSLVLLTNPHNPSGALLSHAELEPTVLAAREVGARVIVDEVYLEFLPDAPARSALAVADNVVVASSFTKAFGLGTARFGWLVGDRAVVDAAIRYNDYVSVLYPNPSAELGGRALAAEVDLARRAGALHRRGLGVLRSWVTSRTDVRWHEPEAGIMALLRLERVTDTRPFCARLHEERGVVVVPGEFFEAPQCVRVGYGIEPALLSEGLAELGAALEAHP